MFGGSLLNDPFFSMHRAHMQRMDQMFQPQDPFGGMMMMQPGPAMGMPMAVTDGREHERDLHRRGERARQQQHQQAMVPQVPGGGMFGGGMFGGGMGMGFGHMDAMMNNMRGMMQNVHSGVEPTQANPNSQFYSQSTVMSYSNDGTGQPKVYQATNSTRQVPGGVRETKKSVRNSETGEQKMSVGRHIGDKGHVITKSRNNRTGDAEENVDYVNIDEDEADQFNREFQQRTQHQHHPSGGHQRGIGDGRSRYDPHSRTHRRQQHTPPAIQYRDRPDRH